MAGGAGGNDANLRRLANRTIANAKLWQGGQDASEVGIKFGRGGLAGGGGERGALGSGGGAGAFIDGDDPSAVGGRDKVLPAMGVFVEPNVYVTKPEAGRGGQYMEIRKSNVGGEIRSYSEGGFGGGGAGFHESAGGGGGYRERHAI